MRSPFSTNLRVPWTKPHFSWRNQHFHIFSLWDPHFIPLFVSGDPRDPLRQAKTQGHRPGAVRSRATEAMKIDQRGIEAWKFYMVLPYLTILLAISSTKSQQLSLGTCWVLGPCHLIHKGMFFQSFMAGWWFGTWLLFFHILGIILPIDELIFFMMVKTTNHLWEYLPSGNLT